MRRIVAATFLGAMLTSCGDDLMTNGTYELPLPPAASPALVPMESRGYVRIELGVPGATSGVDINDAGQILARRDPNLGLFLWQNGTVTEIPTLGGTMSREPPTFPRHALSSAGHVIGRSTLAGDVEEHAFLWHDGVITDLGSTEALDVRAVNGTGQVVGGSGGLNILSGQAFIWESGALTSLGTLGGDLSAAWAINDAGQVAGSSTVSDDNLKWHVFRWKSGAFTDLGTLTDANGFDIPYDINEHGWIAGRAQVSAVFQQGFLWKEGPLIDLGSLGGTAITRTSQPRALNALGHVVGSSFPAETPLFSHAFLWTTGPMIDIHPPDFNTSQASDINDAGQIVGQGTNAVGGIRALLWEGDDIVDLGPGRAEAINADGWIAGTAIIDGVNRAVLWRPGASLELIEVLTASVQELLSSGVLNTGQAASLTSMLEAVVARVERGQVGAAINQLGAFTNYVRALEQGGVLSPDAAASLLGLAHGIIDQLGRSLD